MTVNVLYFAMARDHAGCAGDSFELSAPAVVGDALELVRARHEKLAPLWLHLAVALDGELVGPDAPLHDGAELALLPPVSGG